MVTSDKFLLRLTMRDERRRLAEQTPDAAHRLADNVPADLIGPKGAPLTVAGYHPFRDEIDPGPLMARFAAAGAVLALPVTPPRDAPGPLIFRRSDSGAALAPGAFTVHEPGPDAPVAEPDIILVPLLAFDALGNRLGYGQGHFDRTLMDLRGRRRIFCLGLAYAGQEIGRVPSQAHDERLDAIVTEKGYRAVRKD